MNIFQKWAFAFKEFIRDHTSREIEVTLPVEAPEGGFTQTAHWKSLEGMPITVEFKRRPDGSFTMSSGETPEDNS